MESITLTCRACGGVDWQNCNHCHGKGCIEVHNAVVIEYPLGDDARQTEQAILIEVNNSCSDAEGYSAGHVLFMCLSDIKHSQWLKRAVDMMICEGFAGRIMSPGYARPAGLDIKRRYMFDDTEWGLYPPEVQSLVTVRYQLAQRFSWRGLTMTADNLDGIYRQVETKEEDNET